MLKLLRDNNDITPSPHSKPSSVEMNPIQFVERAGAEWAEYVGMMKD